MKFIKKLDNFFEISARKSTIKTEIIGGLTTFCAMCYILAVNPNQMIGFSFDVPNAMRVWNAIFIATALGSIIGTLLMGLFAKMPFAQTSGMGLNSFFFVSFMVAGFGTATSIFAGGDIIACYSAGLSIIFISGLIFLILSITGLRKKIALALPDCLKKAISAGIGLFIAFIGLKSAGLIQANQYTFVQLVNLNVFSGGVTWYTIAPAISAFLGFLLIGALSKTRVGKANVIIGILATTCLYYLFNIGNAEAFKVFGSIVNPIDTFKDFGELGVQGWFKGFSYWTSGAILQGVLLVITFCLVDMFDTLGTLQGTAIQTGMYDENGNPKNMDKCLMADATATVCGVMLGTSTITTCVESAAGISAGAKTGLSSVVVAFMFFIVMFLSPIAVMIPAAATAPALIYVGLLMLKGFKDIDFGDMTNAIPSFLTLIIMPLTYSISNGIAVGMISYIFLKLFKVFFTKEYSVKEYFSVRRIKEVVETSSSEIQNDNMEQMTMDEVEPLDEVEEVKLNKKKKKKKFSCGEFFEKDIFVLIIAGLFLVRFFMVTM